MTMDNDERLLLVRMDERLKNHVRQSGEWQVDTSARLGNIEDSVSGVQERQAKDNVRLDRIEQREKSRAKLLWAAVTGAVGNAVAWIWSKLA